MPIIVDGYNLACSHAYLDHPRLESARQRVIDFLARYSASREVKVTVVFDGGIEAAYLPRHTNVQGVEVVYSPASSNADTEIKRMLSGFDNPHNWRVVSSDRDIQKFAKRFGADVVSSRDFLREVRDASQRGSDIPGDEPLEKYGGVSGDVDYWVDVFTYDEADED